MSTVDTFSMVHLGRLRSVPLGVEPQRDDLTRAHIGRLALLDGGEFTDDAIFCIRTEDDGTFVVALQDVATFCTVLEADDVFVVALQDDGTFCVLLSDDDEVQL